MKNRITLELQQHLECARVFKALASPVRLKILRCLAEKGSGLNISELAEQFSLPLSTAALHVRVLEKAGLIFIQEKPGLRGAQKICAILVEDVYINIFNRKKEEHHARAVTYSMPIGNYFDVSVTKPCGLAGKKSFIGIEDSKQGFYSSERTHAQIIWFHSGFLEYRFPKNFDSAENLLEISFSFEVCSEAPGYNSDWPSDITVWVNGYEAATFRSAGDYGDKRGIYNPDWWSDNSTQYGELFHLDISEHGCFANGRKSSAFNLDAFKIQEQEFISFKIGIKEDADFIGGLNLFGENFGKYKQNILMTAKCIK
jgi:predicted transcriptional regulator